jgi:hypothetical protein
MVGYGSRDALAARQPGADELVSVSAVDLGAGRAAGGAAGLAGDRQDAAGFVDGGVAVDQFAGAAVDVVGAAAQQNRLQAPSGVPDGTCGDRVGKGGTPLVGCGRAGGMLQPGRRGSVRRSAVLCRMVGPVRSGLPLRRVMWWRVHRDPGIRVSGSSPARYLHGHPSMGRGSYGLTSTVPIVRA